MSDLPPRIARILDRARDAHDPTDEDRARVRSALAAALAAPPSVADAPTGADAAATSGTGAAGTGGAAITATGVKVIALALVVGAAGAYVATRPSPSRDDGPRPAAVPSTALREATDAPLGEQPSAPPDAPAAHDEPAAPEPSTAAEAAPALDRKEPGRESTTGRAPSAARQKAVARTTTEAAPPREPDPRPVAGPTTEGELTLIRAATAALRDGDAQGAAWILDEHATRFPRGVLAQEREALRVLVLCDLGRVGEAQRARERFLRSAPDSPMVERVRNACPPGDAK